MPKQKKVDVGGFGDANKTYDILNSYVERYETSVHHAQGNFTI